MNQTQHREDTLSWPQRPVARVVSWNLWWRFGDDWKSRQHTIAETLADLKFDVAGFQEVWATDGRSQAGMLADSFGFSSAFAGPSLPPVPRPPESPDQEDVQLGVAIVSRWPIAHSWTQPLPTSRPESPIALVAVVDHPLGLWPIVSTCLEWEPALAHERREQMRHLSTLTDAVAGYGNDMPLVLTADLNAPPDSPEVAALTETMVDAWSVSGDPSGVTLDSRNPLAPAEATDQIDRRIDYILARAAPGHPPPRVRRAFLAGTVPAERPPSDHYAVVADITV